MQTLKKKVSFNELRVGDKVKSKSTNTEMNIYTYVQDTSSPTIIVSAENIILADANIKQLGHNPQKLICGDLKIHFADLSKQKTRWVGTTKNPHKPSDHPRQDLEMISNGAVYKTYRLDQQQIVENLNRIYYGEFTSISLWGAANKFIKSFFTIDSVREFLQKEIRYDRSLQNRT
jgi:hypothetical protein